MIHHFEILQIVCGKKIKKCVNEQRTLIESAPG